jgi:hypothetical protein
MIMDLLKINIYKNVFIAHYYDFYCKHPLEKLVNKTNFPKEFSVKENFSAQMIHKIGFHTSTAARKMHRTNCCVY